MGRDFCGGQSTPDFQKCTLPVLVRLQKGRKQAYAASEFGKFLPAFIALHMD